MVLKERSSLGNMVCQPLYILKPGRPPMYLSGFVLHHISLSYFVLPPVPRFVLQYICLSQFVLPPN